MDSVEKSARLSRKSMSEVGLIEDYWQDIFLRLPVESLCRFRVVCKSWNSLISSAFFINLHRSFTHSIAPSKEVCNLRDDVHFPFQFRCDLPAEDKFHYTAVVDVVQGLVCVSYPVDSTFDSNIIWNPAIHRYITLPHLPFPSHIASIVAGLDLGLGFGMNDGQNIARFYSNGVGFGHDRIRDDFKVVRFWLNSPYFESKVGYVPTTYEVYSTRKGYWRMAIADSIKSWMMDFSTSRTGCFVNGRIHWLVVSYDLCVDCVLVFDCETEELTTMDLPQELYKPKATWLDHSLDPVLKAELLEYGGMLSALVHRRWEECIELWVMKDHCLPSSWNKLFTLDTNCGVLNTNCDVLKMYTPSFLKLAPPHRRRPSQWIKFHSYVDRFHQVYAYDETLLLMDDPNAKSYSDKEKVDIFIPRYFSKA